MANIISMLHTPNRKIFRANSAVNPVRISHMPVKNKQIRKRIYFRELNLFLALYVLLSMIIGFALLWNLGKYAYRRHQERVASEQQFTIASVSGVLSYSQTFGVWIQVLSKIFELEVID